MFWTITGEYAGNKVETELPIGLDCFPDVEKTYTHARKYLSKILQCKHHGDANLKVSMVHCADEDDNNEKVIRLIIDGDSECLLYHENTQKQDIRNRC